MICLSGCVTQQSTVHSTPAKASSEQLKVFGAARPWSDSLQHNLGFMKTFFSLWKQMYRERFYSALESDKHKLYWLIKPWPKAAELILFYKTFISCVKKM